MSLLRRRYITDLRYQLRFTAALVRGFAIALLVPACTLIAVFFLRARSAEPSRQFALLAGLPRVIGAFAAVGISFAFATVVLGIYLSHKSIGPLKRIEAWAARHLLGNPSGKLTLRPGDDLDGVATGLARLAEPKPK